MKFENRILQMFDTMDLIDEVRWRLDNGAWPGLDDYYTKLALDILKKKSDNLKPLSGELYGAGNKSLPGDSQDNKITGTARDI